MGRNMLGSKSSCPDFAEAERGENITLPSNVLEQMAGRRSRSLY
jgi:hypothetical protein